MPRVASFEYYDDPVAFTGTSTCTINWTAQTVSYPGVTSIPFASLNSLQGVIDTLANQTVTDLEVDTQRVLYKADGTVVVTINVVANVVAGTVTSVSPGAAVISAAKAKDLAKGFRDYVISTF